MPSSKALKKYLQQYAEPESQCLHNFPAQFNQGLLIPMYRESETSLRRFIDFAQSQQNTLLVIVLNRPETDNDIQWYLELKNAVLDSLNPDWQVDEQPLTLYELPNNSSLLVVDRVYKGTPLKPDEGVGTARKIGADVLCQLINNKHIQSPWIATSDADGHLPSSYFSTLAACKNAAAVVFPYEHTYSHDDPRLPTQLYEYKLHYYVQGLSWSGSPYAFHTVGSTLAIDFEHYAKVRGFPKRAGGEDFYLLNKVAKTGDVITLDCDKIQLEARHSDRVPFGTGPATQQIANQSNPFDTLIYHPDCFYYLHFFLLLLQDLSQSTSTIADSINRLKKHKPEAVEIETLLKLTQFLKLEAALKHCYQQGLTNSTRKQHLEQWFDGFKTLKLIHWIRDNALPSISFSKWIEKRGNYDFLENNDMKKLLDSIKESENYINRH